LIHKLIQYDVTVYFFDVWNEWQVNIKSIGSYII